MSSPPDARDIVSLALAEDLGVSPAVLAPGARPSPEVLDKDATSSAIVPQDAWFEGMIVARQDAVLCALPLADLAWRILVDAVGSPSDSRLEIFPLLAEGARVAAGTPVAEVSGPARLVLAGERTALDFVMVLSGIATQARRWQEAAGPDMTVVDTRKTWPGLRALSKYAVRVGGATNHRSGLWDMVLVKDNHLRAAGGVERAVERARLTRPGLLVEVEADSIDAAVAAAEAGADMVLLDNMDDAMLTAAVAAVRDASRPSVGERCLTEASGGINYERLASLRQTGVDRVSSSAITLAPPADFGLDEVV